MSEKTSHPSTERVLLQEERLHGRLDVLSCALEDLRQSEQDARALLDGTTDVLMRLDVDGGVRLVNAAVGDMLGMTAAAVVGTNLLDYVEAEHVEALHKALAEASALGWARGVTLELRSAYACWEWIDADFHAVPAQGAYPDGFVATIRNRGAQIAEMQILTQERDRAVANKAAQSQFFAAMSHELRTPLNAILGFSEVMSRQMYGPLVEPRYLEYAQLIHESGSHLLELINDVLDMAKIEAGKFAIAPETFALRPEIEMAIRFVKMAADRAGIDISADVATAADYMNADARAVRQCLINLLSNAVKFSPQGGKIRVVAGMKDGAIEIAVSDTGVGIAPKELAMLGAPYVQSRSGIGQGTGLGLSLVKALVGLHAGTVVLDSTPGVGTTVRLRFPKAVPIDAPADANEENGHDSVAAVIALRRGAG